MTSAPAAPEAVLEVSGLSVGYGRPPARGRTVLEGVTARLRAGEFACLIGPNGSGKSTLLRSLVRFQPPLGGEVRVAGRPAAAMSARDLARAMAVVLTDRIAVGRLPAWQIAALGRYPHTGWSGRLSQRDRDAVERALDAVGAAALADREVSELSDGERQRVMIARALAQEPRVLLLDEPSAFLDVRARLELTSLLLSLTHEQGLAVLMSTHDLEHMLRHADSLWLLTGDGRLETGAPEDLGLRGSLQRAVAGDSSFDAYTGTFHAEASARGRVRLTGDGGLRPWTWRAVRRAGYAIAEEGDGAEAEVAWHSANGAARWTLHRGSEHTEARSLADLVAQLRSG